MTVEEKAELEQLRKSARLFMVDPLERTFFELESALKNPHSNRLDSILPTSSFYLIADCLKELKREICEIKRSMGNEG